MKRLIIAKSIEELEAKIEIEEEHKWICTHAPRKSVEFDFYYVHVEKNTIDYNIRSHRKYHTSISMRICQYCGSEYMPKMVFQKFCCTACKDGYHNAIRNAKKNLRKKGCKM